MQEECSHYGLFVPRVEENSTPRVGMVFDSLEEARKFYENYGRAGGFSVRSSSSAKYVKGKLTDKTYVCSKEGENTTNSAGSGMTRTNCKALIQLKLDNEKDAWMIYKFAKVHNHGFTSPPHKTHTSSKNRGTTTRKKVLLKKSKVTKLPIKEQVSPFEGSCGNHGGDSWEEMRGHDVQMLIDYFEWQKERKDPLFRYETMVDCENRLNHCFWVDDLGRTNYERFGDVVYLNIVHDTNRYGLVFVQFVGLNNHLQPVFLGCGLIPNEGKKSFIWLFEKWLEVMEHPPLGLVTPHDFVIFAAVLSVFPRIRHKFCTFQVLDKVSKSLHPGVSLEEFMDPFKENVWYATSTTEFEAQWGTIIEKNDLGSHDLLNRMYASRAKWAPIYNRTHFWAGMCDFQMCKEMNALNKIIVSKKNSLHDFVTIFERFLVRQVDEELKEDHQTLLEKRPKLNTLWKMEKQMSQIYTSRIFCIFQEELQASLVHNIVLVKNDESEANYKVNFCGEQANKKHVKYCKSNQMASCSCLMFEFRGIPCRHLLAFLKYSNLCELPKQYIMQRWSRDIGDETTTNFASRFSELNYLANKVVAESSTSDDAYQLARYTMRETIDQLLSLKHKADERSSGKRFKPTSTEYNSQDRTCILKTFNGCAAQENTNPSDEALSSSGKFSEEGYEDY